MSNDGMNHESPPPGASQAKFRVAQSLSGADSLYKTVGELLQSVDRSSVENELGAPAPPNPGFAEIADASSHMSALWGTVLPPELARGLGSRPRIRGLAKRVVRKVTWWYVEPRWVVQRAIDEEASRMARSTVTVLSGLHQDLAEARREVALLRSRLEALESVTSARQEGLS
jgi:hypothetical protein